MENTPDNKQLRAAIYARVSTQEQREGQTIDSQVAELTTLAQAKSYILEHEYKDDGWSGSLLARPALDALRDDAANGRFQVVLVNDVDRLARDATHLGIIRRDLQRQGVRVIFRKLPSDDSPAYNLLVNVLGSFAEFERDLISDRTRRGRRHKVEVRQQFLGSIATYGLRYIRKDGTGEQHGRLEVHAEEASIVSRIYAWVDEEGMSARDVVRRLNGLSIPPRKGKRWGKSSVLRILRNETYVGTWYYNKHYSCTPLNPPSTSGHRQYLKTSARLRPRSEWWPVRLPESLTLIPRDRWERVQRQLDRNTTFSRRNSKHFYLLRGLVRCGACGARYVGEPSHGRFYYRCFARCRQLPTVKEADLDDTVWSAVREAILNPQLLADAIPRLEVDRNDRLAASSQEAAQLSRALQQVGVEEERLLDAYRIGVLSPGQLAQQLERLRVRKAALEEQRAYTTTGPATDGLPSPRRTIADYCRRASAGLAALNATERQRFLQLLLREVVYQGTTVVLRGGIPVYDHPENKHSGRYAGGEAPSPSSDIGTVGIATHGHNEAAAIDHRSSYSSQGASSIPFELARALCRTDHRFKEPPSRAA